MEVRGQSLSLLHIRSDKELAPHGAETTMTTLAFVFFVLTASSVKELAPNGAETTITTLAIVVFVLTA
jgi:hypothetical protein